MGHRRSAVPGREFAQGLIRSRTAANKAAQGAPWKLSAVPGLRWRIGANRLCARSAATPLGAAQAVSSFAFGACFCRDAPAAPYFAGALFPARRFRLVLGKPLWWRRPLWAAAVLNPRAGARGFAARLCCPAAVLLPPSASGLWPWPSPLVRRSALWSVAPPGGFRLALGGWSFRPPAPLCRLLLLPPLGSGSHPPRASASGGCAAAGVVKSAIIIQTMPEVLSPRLAAVVVAAAAETVPLL